MSDDPIEQVAEKILTEGESTADAYTEGRKCGAFYAGLRSAAEFLGHPLSLSAGVALTETWMVGDSWTDSDEVEEDD